MQAMWPRSIYLGKCQRFGSLTHVERAKGVLGTHGDVPAGLRVIGVYDILIPEPFGTSSSSPQVK
jgi:hypothetical protein